MANKKIISLDVDYIFIITINERKNVARKLVTELVRDGFCSNKIKILVNIKDSANPERGCFNSHQRALRLGRQLRAKRILILEDDVVFSKVKRVIWANINDFLNSNNTWKIFYLGHLPRCLKKIRKKGIVKVNSYLTHAYIVNKAFMKEFIKERYRHLPIDHIYLKNRHAYACYPMVAFQKPIISSIINKENYFTKKETLKFFEKNLYHGIPILYLYLRLALMPGYFKQIKDYIVSAIKKWF